MHESTETESMETTAVHGGERRPGPEGSVVYPIYQGTVYSVEPGTDYSAEPTTLVEFTLTQADDGVLLRIVESGFDRIPADRRATAFEHNSEGWTKQTELVRKYLALSEKV